MSDFEIQLQTREWFSVSNDEIKDFLQIHYRQMVNLIVNDTAKPVSNLFEGQNLLKAVSLKCKVIPTGMFKGCIRLREVDFNDIVEEIKSFAFEDCRSLVRLKQDSSIKRIEGEPFKDTLVLNKNKVQIGQCLVKFNSTHSVETLQNYSQICMNCFKNNEILSLLVIEPTVEVIDSYAFNNCTSLEIINVTSNTIIKPFAFNNSLWENVLDDLYTMNGILYRKKDVQLSSIIIPNDTVVIPQGLFENCTTLKKVIFNSNLQRIERNAFKGCIGLQSISINTRMNLVIEQYAFAHCTGIKSVDIKAKSKIIDKDAFFCSTDFNRTNWFIIN